eukprot:GCRY01004061.1.p1 GENE.GCRY01004061.1~~GCRY01004061.1.p1  ORF type:complete len:103 (+),score=21.03 GCRY01004061.1:105-413(+)
MNNKEHGQEKKSEKGKTMTENVRKRDKTGEEESVNLPKLIILSNAGTIEEKSSKQNEKKTKTQKENRSQSHTNVKTKQNQKTKKSKNQKNQNKTEKMDKKGK